MTPFVFIIAGLACYRVTVLITRDAGPWEMFKRLRKVARFSKLLGCPFCVSVWVALLIDIALHLNGYRGAYAVEGCQIFAMSAISIALDRMFTADVQN